MARWAQDVDVKEGALRGWAAKDAPATRRAALRKVVDADGYGTAVRRLNYLANVSKEPRVAAAARSDMDWLKQTYRQAEKAEK